MKILYWANFTDKQFGFFKDIESSLKSLGHQVESINDRDFKNEELIEKANNSDLFFFHHGGIWTDNEINYSLSLERLKQILTIVKAKKVCWFFEKCWFLNDRTMEEIIPLTDYVFLNDETWVRRHKYENVFGLHSGVGQVFQGKKRKEYETDIAFYGHVYGFRKPYIELLKENYGGRFKIYEGLFEQDLADLIASAKMIFVPVQPNDEFYWDNRIYQVLGHKGIIVYPRLHGLKEEGFVSGKHYLGYKKPNELIAMINDYLSKPKELEKMRLEGFNFVQRFTYKERLKELFSKIKEEWLKS